MDRLKDLKVPLLDKELHIAIKSDEGSVKETDALQLYLKDIERTTDNINKIQEAAGQILSNGALIRTHTREEHEVAMVELDRIITKTNKIAANVQMMVESLQTTCNLLKVPGRNQSRDYTVRNNLLVILMRKYVEVMRDYQDAQRKYNKEIKLMLKRRMTILNPKLQEQEITDAMDSGVNNWDLLAESVLQGESEAVRNAAISVRNKYQDVLALEKSITELAQMFRDFALIVDQQGGLLDQIEENVKRTDEWVAGANEHLQETVNLQRSLRYKQCCLATLICFVLGGIIAIIFLKANGAI